eukprot:272734-Karenia_brevis.AAC.1
MARVLEDVLEMFLIGCPFIYIEDNVFCLPLHPVSVAARKVIIVCKRTAFSSSLQVTGSAEGQIEG